jgi:hypothetical protein
LPQATETGLAILISEFRGDLAPDYFDKALGPDTRLEEITVNGNRAYWIEGRPHSFTYRWPDQTGPSTRGETEVLRLAGNTLLWEDNGVTIRIESALGKADALRIAESMR